MFLCVSLLVFYLHKAMALYSPVSLPDLATIPFKSKPPQPQMDASLTDNHWPVSSEENTLQAHEASSSQSPSRSACSSHKQCKFCVHFHHELTHWGHCDALSSLVPSQASACVLHEPCFNQAKKVVPLAQLKRSTVNEDALKVLNTQSYYQYPSAKCP